MALSPGTRLGAYEIVSLLGAGGMGEVYRARDTKLGREVAIKVLPELFVADPERVARFQREAKTLAALNHPHIGAIYGLEEANASQFLVLELVDGESLDKRIARGAIPVGEALAIAKQIAEALEAAHEKGIIHRDLKPANIAVTSDGHVKVLDFGLAKAIEPASGLAIDLANSPTITSPAMMTGIGVMLGTAAYMAPEQARGRPVDKRADIWAFGCILFEIITARQAFAGDTVSDALAAVLRAEPGWTLLPATTAPQTVHIVRRCLQKDARKRYQHIGDARVDLEEPIETIAPVGSTPMRGQLLKIAAAFIVGAAIAGSTAWLAETSPVPAAVARFSVRVPPTMPLRASSSGVTVVLSPDGKTLVYTTGATPRDQLIRRRIDTTGFEPVRGSDFGANAPFFSPDGRWVAFSAQGKLRKIPLNGGVASTICDSSSLVRGTWGDDNSIVYSDRGRLFRVSAGGGVPQLLLDERTVPEGLFEPHFVAGFSAVLVRVGGPVRARIEAVELPSLRRHALVSGSTPQVTATGDLVFHRDGQLWTARLDEKRWAMVGEPVPVGGNVRVLADLPLFSLSKSGSLVYVADTTSRNASIVWLDRSGRASAAIEERAPFEVARLSPDGRRVVVNVPSGQTNDIWVYELDRGTRLRLTSDANNRRPVWSPDGERIAFNSDVDSETDLFAVSVNGGRPERLLRRPGTQFPDAWAPDGKSLVFNEGSALRDLWILPIGGGAAPKPLVQTSFNERGAAISPNGRWVAFTSDESGRDEIYVLPYPDGGFKVPVSKNGGRQAVWSRDGREVFYREGSDLMAVMFQETPLQLRTAQKLFEFDGRVYGDNPNTSNYDVASDGRFLAVRTDEARSDEIQVVLNWTEELKARVPTK